MLEHSYKKLHCLSAITNAIFDINHAFINAIMNIHWVTALSGDGPTNVSHHKTYGVPHVASINLFVIQYGNTNN